MINEHDITDMCNLYELHKGDRFRLVPEEESGEPVKVPPAHDAIDLLAEYGFQHIDGMYSFCTDANGIPVHFAAWTKVHKL